MKLQRRPQANRQHDRQIPGIGTRIKERACQPEKRMVGIGIAMQLLHAPNGFGQPGEHQHKQEEELQARSLRKEIAQQEPQHNQLPAEKQFFGFGIERPIVCRERDPGKQKQQDVRQRKRNAFPPSEPYRPNRPNRHQRHRQVEPEDFPHHNAACQPAIAGKRRGDQHRPENGCQCNRDSMPVQFEFHASVIYFHAYPFFIRFSS